MTKLYSVTMPDNRTYVAVGLTRQEVARKYGASMANVSLGAKANLPPISQYRPTLSPMRLKILLAIADCDPPPTFRELAAMLGLSLSGLTSYFFTTSNGVQFVNGEYVTWTPGKSRTLSLTERGKKAIRGYALRRFLDGPVKIYRIVREYA